MLYKVQLTTFAYNISQAKELQRDRPKVWLHKGTLLYYLYTKPLDVSVAGSNPSTKILPMPLFLKDNEIIFYFCCGGANYATGLEYLIGRGYIEECN